MSLICDDIARFTRFQFHKVQLKAEAIIDFASSSSFQFHKVQLKETRRNKTSQSATMFQFHKVQLKA